jgi:hypothetical protein
MWIYTNQSFVSVVEPHGQRKDLLLVRARVAGDIETLFPKARVKITQERDYRFRAFVPRKVVAATVAKQIEGISYSNFKDSVANKKRHDHYSRVWWATQEMQEGGAYGRDTLHPEIQKALSPKRQGKIDFDAWGDVVEYDTSFGKMYPKKSPRKGA